MTWPLWAMVLVWLAASAWLAAGAYALGHARGYDKGENDAIDRALAIIDGAADRAKARKTPQRPDELLRDRRNGHDS